MHYYKVLIIYIETKNRLTNTFSFLNNPNLVISTFNSFLITSDNNTFDVLSISVPPIGALRRRAALVDDDETRLQMRKAIENTALSVTGILKVKKKARLFSEEKDSQEDTKDPSVEEDCKQLRFCSRS